ncbi:unnamed protein product [Sympodiomycopsis kandeliae]
MTTTPELAGAVVWLFLPLLNDSFIYVWASLCYMRRVSIRFGKNLLLWGWFLYHYLANCIKFLYHHLANCNNESHSMV